MPFCSALILKDINLFSSGKAGKYPAFNWKMIFGKYIFSQIAPYFSTVLLWVKMKSQESSFDTISLILQMSWLFLFLLFFSFKIQWNCLPSVSRFCSYWLNVWAQEPGTVTLCLFCNLKCSSYLQNKCYWLVDFFRAAVEW